MTPVVRKNTPEKLVVDLRPGGCRNAIYVGSAILLTLAGLGVLHVMGGHIELSVADGKVHYQRNRLFGGIRKQFEAASNEITDITLEVREKYMSRIYKVVLHTADGEFDTDFPSLDGDEKREITTRLRAAVTGENGSYFYEESSTIGAVLLGGVCILGAIRLFLVLQVVVVKGNREIGYLQINRRRILLPFGSDRCEIQLADYRGMKTRADTVVSASGQRTTSYKVLIKRAGGKPLPLAYDSMFTDDDAGKVIEIIDKWVQKRTGPASGD